MMTAKKHQGVFVTGTDTDIGKTVVSRLLIELLVQQGNRVAAMKPVASGAQRDNGKLINADATSLMQAANIELDYTDVNPYVFAPAVSPHIAAEQAGIEIELDIIRQHALRLQQCSDIVVVEGVGGWHAPLSMNCTVADMAETLQLPVVLVVGMRLGCLNHALLTAQAIRLSSVPIAGWIANHIDQQMVAADKNMATLRHYLHDFPFLGEVHHLSCSADASHTINIEQLLSGIRV